MGGFLLLSFHAPVTIGQTPGCYIALSLMAVPYKCDPSREYNTSGTAKPTEILEIFLTWEEVHSMPWYRNRSLLQHGCYKQQNTKPLRILIQPFKKQHLLLKTFVQEHSLYVSNQQRTQGLTLKDAGELIYCTYRGNSRVFWDLLCLVWALKCQVFLGEWIVSFQLCAPPVLHYSGFSEIQQQQRPCNPKSLFTVESSAVLYISLGNVH